MGAKCFIVSFFVQMLRFIWLFFRLQYPHVEDCLSQHYQTVSVNSTYSEYYLSAFYFCDIWTYFKHNGLRLWKLD